MKTSVSMYSLHDFVVKGMNILEFIEYASKIGVDGVELLNIYWKDEDAELPGVLEYLKKYNLQVSAYDATNNFVKPTKEERLHEIEHVKRAIDTAKRLNTNVVRIFSGDISNSVSLSQGMEWILECMKECAKYAEKQGIVLGIENHGLFAGKSEQVINLIKEVGSDYIRSTIDTGNFLLVDENPSNAVANLKDYAVHVHIKDFEKIREKDDKGPIFQSIAGHLYVGKIAGEGNVDLKRILKELESANYSGWISVEFEGTEEPKYGTETSLQNLKELLKS